MDDVERIQIHNAKVKLARESQGLTQDEIAGAMRIEQTAYSKYEIRSFMPSRHLHTFCLICHVTPEWLMSPQKNAAVSAEIARRKAKKVRTKKRQNKAKRFKTKSA